INIDMVPPTVIASATPASLWPPNGQMTPVTVTGRAIDGLSGCDQTPGRCRCTVIDEYGAIQPTSSFTLKADGTFQVVFSLHSSRSGGDKDGRHYTITVTVCDRAG